MKEIKIRFVQRGKENVDYLIQKKTIFGWKNITYESCAGVGAGYCFDVPYQDSSKENLLQDVLEKHYKMDKRFVRVKEYPKIKIY